MYRASRGSIIPEFLCSDSTDDFISNFDPSGLEPFTLIFVDEDKKILELGWDENTFHFFDKSSDIPLIYSSATLYNSEICERRKSIFMSHIDNQIDSSDIWKFHEKKGSDHGGFVNVDYNDEISTVAIGQIVVGDISVFHYQSLLSNNIKHSVVLEQ